jgi:predicted dehydrogenase
MLEKERDLDAVYIMTPEHLHATIALHAMRAGKHVLTHKPIANVLHELRVVLDAGRQSGVVTQLFCSSDLSSTPALREWVQGGVIGPVREVHNWSNRPFWPQGMTRPADTPPVPEGLEWDLWLGPVPHRPYHPDYTHAVFRGWYDFGTGALGDMGHYSFCQIFRVLNLGTPTSVEATRSQSWKITDYTWRRELNLDSYPRASWIRWEFPPRGDSPSVALHWYDGGLRPPVPPELDADRDEMPEEGLLLVGERGKLIAGFSGMEPRLLPRSRMGEFKPPAATSPKPPSELDQFINACRGGETPIATFESAYPFAETILLGTIALRVNQKLHWDSEKFEFTNSQEANALKVREYRPGWEV